MKRPANQEPTISVCIPSKNRPADMFRCLASLDTQTRRPQEIIVVDQSDSPYVLPRLEGLVHIHDRGLSGLAAAKNLAVSRAKRDIVLFLDDDVELLPGCIEALLDAFQRRPDAGGMTCAVLNGGAGLPWWSVHTWLFARGFFNAAPMGDGDLPELRRLQGCALAAKRSLLEEEPVNQDLIGYSYGEDWELSYRLRRHGALLLVPGAQLIHYASPKNRYSKRQLQRDRWENFLYFYDHLHASRIPLNRVWRWWWMCGESLLWLKEGMGLPFARLASARAPERSLSLKRPGGT